MVATAFPGSHRTLPSPYRPIGSTSPRLVSSPSPATGLNPAPPTSTAGSHQSLHPSTSHPLLCELCPGPAKSPSQPPLSSTLTQAKSHSPLPTLFPAVDSKGHIGVQPACGINEPHAFTADALSVTPRPEHYGPRPRALRPPAQFAQVQVQVFGAAIVMRLEFFETCLVIITIFSDRKDLKKLVLVSVIVSIIVIVIHNYHQHHHQQHYHNVVVHRGRKQGKKEVG